MGGNSEDDKATVVLDINALKKELAEKSAAGEGAVEEQEFEFAVHSGTTSPNATEGLSLGDDLDLGDDALLEEENKSVVLFDFQSEYFTKLSEKLPKAFDYKIIKELKDLNTILGAKEPVIILFNYNAAPKAVTQLTTQIKAKFSHAKTVIIAKGLTEDKIAQHKNSKAGADAYLSVPFNLSLFEQTLKKL